MTVLLVHWQVPMPSVRRPDRFAAHFTSDPRDPDRERERLPLAALPTAVASARRFVVAQLRTWGLEPLVDDVELVTSELVTNAVREVGLDTVPDGYAALHTAAPPLIVLQLRLTAHRVLCEVWDPSPELPVRSQAGPFDEGGRGMALIATLASRWGCYPSPAGRGKVVLAWWGLSQPSP
jgi:anti-sigma regulatory factor (Ser/Thr protein kinase)